MAQSKLISEAEAIARFVADGDVVYAGYAIVPHALCHEVIRQKKRDLDIVGGSVGPQGNYWFYTGCASRTRTGYIGGALREGFVTERMRSGDLRWEDYTNQTVALMLMAGALGIPFIPTRSFLGTDYLRDDVINHAAGFLGPNKMKVVESPFDGQKVVLLPALRPDVTLIHAQRADEEGNVQAWGALGDARWGCWAAKKLIVSVEEIVPSQVIRSDPQRTLVPSFRVAAVVHAPFGAHPSGLAGFYDVDFAFSRQEGMASVRKEEMDRFLAEWVYGVPDRRRYWQKYLSVYGEESLARIRPQRPATPIATVDYGYSQRLGWG